jgi:hypothetical protein
VTPFSPPTGTHSQLPLAEACENAVQLRSALPRRVALGTMHGKEQALSAAFVDIGVEFVVPPDLDTDMFGTFTGETPREGTMLDAARAKAIRAASLTGLSVGLASEGSYGPHPFIPFLPAGRELLVWHDLKSGLEVTEMIIDEAPCHAHSDVRHVEEAADFLEGIGFPRQALVASPVGAEERPVAKGIGDAFALEKAVDLAVSLSPRSRARLQTDMRACFNPRRMTVIAKLGRRLATRLATPCPHCNHPGWGWVGGSGALCCSDCGCPTQMPSHDVLGCVACDARETVERSPEAEASPSCCPLCNP